jgi:hypothetical protein
LAAYHQADAEIGRARPARARKPKSARKPVAAAALGTIAVYLRRRPIALPLGVAGLAVVLVGFHVVDHSEVRRPPKPIIATHELAPPPTPPEPPAQTPAAESRPQTHPVVGAPETHVEAEPPVPVKRPPMPPRSIVASRDPALEAWFIKSYLRCWSPPSALPQGEAYAAQVRVTHNADGSLSGGPVLVNPPSDPAWRAYADSAVRAVTKCNPLQVPARYSSHFDQWRKLTLHFSPDA